MPKKENTAVSHILAFLMFAGDLLPRPFEYPYAHVRRIRKMAHKDYYNTVLQLKKRGVVSIQNKAGKNFIALTQKGVLEILLQKANVQKQKNWDGKWRVLVFDIPEDAHLQRDRLRRLLKRYGFLKLQASVFIHPYSLNREAIAYLKESGLDRYIRILKVEEIDSDADLRKKFGL